MGAAGYAAHGGIARSGATRGLLGVAVVCSAVACTDMTGLRRAIPWLGYEPPKEVTARVDGLAFTGRAPIIADRSRGDTLNLLVGMHGGRPDAVALWLRVPISGPGTFVLWPDGGDAWAAVSDSTGVTKWLTSENGGSGEITVLTVTPTHVTGTFRFTAIASPGMGYTPRTRVVTDGKFDIRW